MTGPDWLSCSVWADILYRHSLKLFNLCSHLWSAQPLINAIIIKRSHALPRERLKVQYFEASTKNTFGMSHWYLYSIELYRTSVSMSISCFWLRSLYRKELLPATITRGRNPSVAWWTILVYLPVRKDNRLSIGLSHWAHCFFFFWSCTIRSVLVFQESISALFFSVYRGPNELGDHRKKMRSISEHV